MAYPRNRNNAIGAKIASDNISRVLFISTNTVLKLIRQAAEKVPEPDVPKRIASLELDQFWSFVEKKKQQRWTWYALDRQR